MPFNLVIRNVPDQLVDLLRQRAAAHHRSLQGELLAILEEAVVAPAVPLTVAQVLARVRRDGVSTPAEAVAMLRADRDTCH